MTAVQGLLLLAGYAVAVFGGAVAVEAGLRRLLRAEDVEGISSFRRMGLHDAGRIIGCLERFLFLTFVLADAWSAVGFVLAAKGLIRYGEIQDDRDHKIAEYVLIGTMASLAWAVTVGLLVRRWIG
ncbi:MAG: hypothetical protein SCH98_00435 [Deferrisomatales bacterium]|nr:hypothetical protein [Deferrisomatales bacterium]